MIWAMIGLLLSMPTTKKVSGVCVGETLIIRNYTRNMRDTFFTQSLSETSLTYIMGNSQEVLRSSTYLLACPPLAKVL